MVQLSVVPEVLHKRQASSQQLRRGELLHLRYMAEGVRRHSVCRQSHSLLRLEV